MNTTNDIAERITALKEDERAILERLLERIEQGRTSYGPWKVTDGRDYPKEALDEVLDALHYCAAALLRMSLHCRCGNRCEEILS